MAIEKIMERESALNVIEEIKNKICEVDLDSICDDETKIVGGNEAVYKKLVQAVMCGLVYWDEEKKCLVQKLIRPIKSGEIERQQLEYKHKVSFGRMRRFKGENPVDYAIETIAAITASPKPVIDQLTGQDQQIATGCADFFS